MVTHKQRRTALSSRIEITRKERGASKRHLYTAAGVSQNTYDRKIAGLSDFTFSELIDIAEVLGVTVSDLTDANAASAQHDSEAA